MGSAPCRASVVLALVACAFDSSGSGNGRADLGETSAEVAEDGGPSDDGVAATTLDDDGAADGTTGGPTIPTDSGSSTSTSGGGTSSSDSSDDPSAGAADSGTTGGFEWGPFQPPVPMPVVNSIFMDDDPSMRADMLELVFASNRSLLGEDVWIAVRPSILVEFGEPTALPEPLNLLHTNETTPELSADGLVLTFASNREGGAPDLYVTTRADVLSPWAAPVRIDELSTTLSEVAFVTTSDQLDGYFCRWFDPTDLDQLMYTTRSDPGAAWDPAAVMMINTAAVDCSPWVNAEGTELWFESTRAGGEGAEDIWRAELDGAITGEPEPITELNTAAREQDVWLSPAGDIVMFSSDRAGANMDIYYSTRAPS